MSTVLTDPIAQIENHIGTLTQSLKARLAEIEKLQLQIKEYQAVASYESQLGKLNRAHDALRGERPKRGPNIPLARVTFIDTNSSTECTLDVDITGIDRMRVDGLLGRELRVKEVSVSG